MIESQTLTAASDRRPLAIEWTQLSRQTAIGLAVAAIAWVLVVAVAEPFGRPWGHRADGRVVVASPAPRAAGGGAGGAPPSFWLPILANPYLKADWTNPLAYVYSP